MARRRDVQTGDLFEVPQPAEPVAASMDYRRLVSEMISEMLDEADGDRYEIATRCSRLAGKEVSKYMLDAYSSGAREEYNAPAWLMPVLEVACDTHSYTQWLTGTRGGVLLVGRDALSAELGREQRKIDAARRRLNKLKKQIGAEPEGGEA